ncbi:YdiU family protein [Alteromonas pelagimontana]|uniref:Protein nucleotidyltransferase YdiU n=1 Tax=Alteromonas pelagimontana TaxID=1858656 RepID=A0A6M4MDC7_9ALTE|nr:YdiU family protein [Alteromonas pelagimontana]QJR81194.1 YdiU family protein [Alteromonas pelagimontana]
MKLTHHYKDELAPLVSAVKPVPLSDMKLALVNAELAAEFDLPDKWWQHNNLNEALHDPASDISRFAIAQKYGGHQFGHWNPYLGDGRGLLLGEVTSSSGKQCDLHLKGAGQTPYSRHADGRAVLRSTLRKYIAGEALHHLGIPSSRSLCLFTSHDTVYRERPERGAMMIRMAPSHIRFGHFEYFYHAREQDKLEALFKFTFNHHFPECKKADNPHYALLRSITLKTARMVALWQAYGFVHGVMNTDNMSIHGITFDYGPYAFMGTFIPSIVFNHSDHEGRYAFDRQPGVALWNLNALAHSFSDSCTMEEIRDALSQFEPNFLAQYQAVMVNRLGFDEVTADTVSLLNDWLDMLAKQQRDYTASFRRLSLTSFEQQRSTLRDDFPDRDTFDTWWQRYYEAHQRANHSYNEKRAALLAINPAVIARTHLLQEAIDAAQQDDFSVSDALIEAVKHPFDERYDNHKFSHPPVDDAQVSLSCSS